MNFHRLVVFNIFLACLYPGNFTEAGTLLVANKSSHSVTFFDEDGLNKIAEVPVGNEPHEIALSPSGSRAVVSNCGTSCRPGASLTVLDVATTKVLQTIVLPTGSRPHGIQFISEEDALVTAEGIQSLLWVNIRSGNVTRKLPLPGSGAHLLALDQEKQHAFVSNIHSGTLTKIALASFQVISEQKIGRAAEGILLTPDGSHVLLTNRKDHVVAVLRTADLAWASTIPTDRGPIRLALFDFGRHIALTNCESGSVQTIDLASMRLASTFKSTKSFSVEKGQVLGGLFGFLPVPISILVKEDQQTAFVANSFAGNITLVDLQQGVILETFSASIEPDGLALSGITTKKATEISQRIYRGDVS